DIIDLQSGAGRANLALHRRHQRLGTSLGADEEVHPVREILFERHVDAPLWRLGERRVVGGARHADDLAHRLFARNLEAAADRILIGPQVARHFRIDDRDGYGVVAILPAERAAALDGDTAGLEIVAIDGVEHAGHGVGW